MLALLYLPLLILLSKLSPTSLVTSHLRTGVCIPYLNDKQTFVSGAYLIVTKFILLALCTVVS